MKFAMPTREWATMPEQDQRVLTKFAEAVADKAEGRPPDYPAALRGKFAQVCIVAAGQPRLCWLKVGAFAADAPAGTAAAATGMVALPETT